MAQEEPWGTCKLDGKAVRLLTLTAEGSETRLRVCTYGATLVSLTVPDREGTLGDVLLGFDDLASYEAHQTYINCAVGRVCSRIAEASFRLGDTTYQLPPNNGAACHHGGPVGFNRYTWDVVESSSSSVTLRLESPDLDQGFPGKLTTTVQYSLLRVDGGDTAVSVRFHAETDKTTVVNLTNHVYFNLAGVYNSSGDARSLPEKMLDQVVSIAADTFVPTDEVNIPLGTLRSVDGTPFDFRTPTRVGARIEEEDEQLRRYFQTHLGGSGAATLVLGRSAKGKMRQGSLLILLQILSFPCWTGKATPDADDAVCAAGDSCTTGARKVPEAPYIWPMARGPVGSHATSPHRGPRGLSDSLAWSWRPHGGRLPPFPHNGGLLIDGEKNVYTTYPDSISKLSPDGRLLWSSAVEGISSDIPALMDGLLFATSLQGHVEAISMASGKRVWKSAPVCTWKTQTVSRCHPSCSCHRIGSDIGAVGAHKGVIVVKTHEPEGGGACRAAGLNASNGAFLWDYATDKMVWNFYPIFTDDGESFLFQDSTGGVYRLGLDGKEIWKAGGNSEAWKETFTDGGLQTGPNGVVYAVKALGGDNLGPGCVRAYRIDDGSFLWQSPDMDEVPNTWPVIGRMRKDDPLTVIVATGRCGFGIPPPFFPFLDGLGSLWQSRLVAPVLHWLRLALIAFTEWLGDYAQDFWAIPDMQAEVWGMDAETGVLLWKWAPPPWKRGYFRGEYQRVLGGEMFCYPNPAGNPTLDASGDYYIGLLDGIIYHLRRDDHGPGVKVASTFDAEMAFSNGGVSIAPGMMGIASCNTVFVFKGGEQRA